jgi:hypothetical protein
VLSHVRGRAVARYKTIAALPQGTTYGLDIDPTNKYMVTAGQDKRLNIWSIVSGRHVRAYKTSAGATWDGSAAAGGELYKVSSMCTYCARYMRAVVFRQNTVC